MATLADTLRVLNELEATGAIEAYAIGGAMAMVFWAEPTATFDLDAFVLLRDQPGAVVISLEPIYRALRSRGFAVDSEHVLIHGTPVQFLVSPNALADDAVANAAVQEIDGVRFRVMRPAATRDIRVGAMDGTGGHARPSPQLEAAQRGGKVRWRRAMVQRPFKEKLRIVLEMQRRVLPLIARRRALRWWEQPWEIEG